MLEGSTEITCNTDEVNIKKNLKFICLKLQLTESEILQQMSIYIRLTVKFSYLLLCVIVACTYGGFCSTTKNIFLNKAIFHSYFLFKLLAQFTFS